jgi:hypothetical protein|tara:strand:+ start:258 stop:545 length:288 start_codon:yes stop_codon:yes gene_type:complete
MEKMIDLLSEKVVDKSWKQFEFRGKEYMGITIGSYEYPNILSDFNSLAYIKMIMKNYFINDYEIVERQNTAVSGISIFIQKDQFVKLEYFLQNIK